MKFHKYLLTGLFLCVNAQAGDFDSTIEYVQVVETTATAVIKFDVDPTNNPTCATGLRMAVNLSTDAGKAIYSLALSAQTSGRKVFGKGTGACDIEANKDSIRYIRQL